MLFPQLQCLSHLIPLTNPRDPLQPNSSVASPRKPTRILHRQNRPPCPSPCYSCTLYGLFQKESRWGEPEHWTWSLGELVSGPNRHFLLLSPWVPFLASASLPVKKQDLWYHASPGCERLMLSCQYIAQHPKTTQGKCKLQLVLISLLLLVLVLILVLRPEARQTAVYCPASPRDSESPTCLVSWRGAFSCYPPVVVWTSKLEADTPRQRQSGWEVFSGLKTGPKCPPTPHSSICPLPPLPPPPSHPTPHPTPPPHPSPSPLPTSLPPNPLLGPRRRRRRSPPQAQGKAWLLSRVRMSVRLDLRLTFWIQPNGPFHCSEVPRNDRVCPRKGQEGRLERASWRG